MKNIIKAIFMAFAVIFFVPTIVEARAKQKIKVKKVKRTKAIEALRQSLKQVEKSKAGGTSKKNRSKKKEEEIQKLNAEITKLEASSEEYAYTADSGKTYMFKPSNVTVSSAPAAETNIAPAADTNPAKPITETAPVAETLPAPATETPPSETPPVEAAKPAEVKVEPPVASASVATPAEVK